MACLRVHPPRDPNTEVADQKIGSRSADCTPRKPERREVLAKEASDPGHGSESHESDCVPPSDFHAEDLRRQEPIAYSPHDDREPDRISLPYASTAAHQLAN